MIVVLPMAGRGHRFVKEGYETPKPLIDVMGVPMFVRALESIKGLHYSKLVIIALKEHDERYDISAKIQMYLSEIQVNLILISEVTEGQLCTVMKAAEEFRDESVLVLASDSYIMGNLTKDLHRMDKADGIISVAKLPGDSWSFAKTDEQGKVVEVAEKVRISDHASTGIYYFRSGNKFIDIANEIVRNNERVRGEFYIIPVYQKMLEAGLEIRVSMADQMWDMGTPENLNRFLDHLKQHS